MTGTGVKPTKQTGYPGRLSLLAVWSLVGALAYGRHYLVDGGGSAEIPFQFAGWLICFWPWVEITPRVFRLEQKFPLEKSGWAGSAAKLSLAGLLLSYLAAEMSLCLGFALEFVFRRSPQLPQRWWTPQPLELFIQLMAYAAVVASAHPIRNRIELREREREAAQLALEKSQLESSLRQAQLETLRTRLNPHFLFNCLQNIAVLTEEDPKTATQMLARLGELLRAALRQNSSPETSLETEIVLTKTYIAVEQVRFADRLSVLFDIAPESAKAFVPTFLLQPLVENAIVHGLRGQGAGIISIRSAIESGNLLLAVTDNGIGLPAGDRAAVDPGVGLSSTCERLAKMYPQRHSFSIRPLPEGGTEVQITLPLRFEHEQGQVVTHETTSLVDRR